MKDKIKLALVFSIYAAASRQEAEARPAKADTAHLLASNKMGAHRIAMNGSAQPILMANEMTYGVRDVQVSQMARDVLSSLEGKSVMRTPGKRDGDSSFFVFSHDRWDVAFDKSGSRGWARLREPAKPDEKKSAELNERDLVRLAEESVKKHFSFVARDSSRGFGYEVSRIGSVSVTVSPEFAPEKPEETRQVAHLVRVRRSYDGIPFMGSGSMITFEFDLSGDLIGYSFDWVPLQVKKRKKRVLQYGEIISRLNEARRSMMKTGDPSVSMIRCGYNDRGSYALAENPTVDLACRQMLESNIGAESPEVGLSGKSSVGIVVSAFAEKK